MPAWSRPRTAKATTSSGPAAMAIEARPTKEPRSRAGLRNIHGRAADQEDGDQDGRMSGLRLAHPDQILCPASAGALAGIVLLGALPPARRKGSLTLVRDGLPNLPRPGPSSGACAGRVIPLRPGRPCYLHPRSRPRAGLQRHAALLPSPLRRMIHAHDDPDPERGTRFE